MAMVTAAIRFAPEEKAWIQDYADFRGCSFSEAVREAILEKVEEAADLEAYKAALAQDDGARYMMDEVMAAVMDAE